MNARESNILAVEQVRLDGRIWRATDMHLPLQQFSIRLNKIKQFSSDFPRFERNEAATRTVHRFHFPK